MRICIKKPTYGIGTKKRTKFRVVLSPAFRAEVEALSYRQLVRVSSFADARTAAEVAEAKHITRALLPKEASVVRNIKRTTNPFIRKAKIDFLRTTLDKKNAQETSSVNADAVLRDLFKP